MVDDDLLRLSKIMWRSKPRLTFLLTFTSIAAAILAFQWYNLPYSGRLLLWVAVCGALASAGCNAITSYIDVDIDGAMMRTRRRPLPSGRISPPEKAVLYGGVLLFLSLVIAIRESMLSFLWILMGALFNIVVYNLLLKRRSSLSVVIGGSATGFPSCSAGH